MTTHRMLTLALLAASLTVAGCSGARDQVSADNATTATPMPMNDTMSMGMTPSPSDPPATQSYKKSMSDMMANMPAYTGDADADFMRQMKVHHASAIAMADVELRHGRDARARALAEKIIGDQRAEIAEIDAWLAARK